jgi:amidase
MISLKDYTAHDGLGLAELVARKEVTPDELGAAAFEAVAKVNPRINAVLHTIPKEAAAEIRAGLPRGPFTGVPFLIKEIVLHAKGVRCEMGSKLAQGYVPDADTELMARFRRAGFVLAGTTQTPEFGYNPTTETRAFGPVHNPWDLGRSPGGSSGGSGAAVAAGIVPIAHANDGGGSIRIPASCNGLVGLKPSRDRIPSGPDYGDLLCGLACEFALTRSVRRRAACVSHGRPRRPQEPRSTRNAKRPCTRRCACSKVSAIR